MATATPTRLAPQISAMLANLRRRISAYIWTEGLAVMVAWLGAAFWVSLALDWSMEPPTWFRRGMLAIAGIGLVYIFFRFIVRRLWRPIADRNLALLLERRFRDFDESLLTTVELTEQPNHAAAFHPQMLAGAEHAAIRCMAGVQLGDVFRRGPLVRSLFGAAAAIVSIGAFAWFAPQAFGIWQKRVIQSSDILWPRRVHLSIEGFDNPERRVVVAKGADLTVVAKADSRFEIPDTLQIRFRTEEGRSRENMSRVGIASSEDRYQTYSFTFRGILSSRTFDIFGGDAALRDYRIDVVDVPTIELVLHCEYPPYTRMLPRDLPARSLEVPQGSRVTIHATANKDLVEASIERLTSDTATPLASLKFNGNADRRHFSYTIPRLDETQTLLFTLFDTDGIHNREPIRLNLTSRPDEPPHVGVRLRGIGSSVTPNARLPLDGDVTDDYGISKMWYEFKAAPEAALEQAATQKVPLATQPRDRTAIHFDRDSSEALDLKDRGIAVGQQLVIAVNALDNCALGKSPNFGPGEKFQLAVVSPEQLLSILEARELTLRMRLESVVQDVQITRDHLAAMKFDSGKRPVATKPGATKPAPGSEPGDTADSGSGLSSGPVVVGQAIANGEQSASETLSLALSFDDIRDELSNNRIDTPELEYRLKDQIGDPLREIAQKMFPELGTRLRKLDAALADPAKGKLRRDEALAQTDAVLAAMHQVLSKMLELESFNEVVEQLRDLIDAEKALHANTVKRQKEKTLKLNE